MSDKNVYFVSLGCPKNHVDSEVMMGSLSRYGYQSTSEVENAEVIVVNTCGFIEDAKKESISKILEMVDISNKQKKVIVAGCLVQRYKENLAQEMPEVDLFIGSGDYQNIGSILKNHNEGHPEKYFFHLPPYLNKDISLRTLSGPIHSTYLKISEGCQKRCSFCAIPVIRGNLQSRSIESVIEEAWRLQKAGVQELNVVSHDFSDYGKDLMRKDKSQTVNSAKLLQALAQVKIPWIRILYLYPDGVTDEVLNIFKNEENLVNYFDMPLQHINDSMLKSMNRHMSKSQIVDILGKIRSTIPNSTIRSQFIVGFPGETEEHYNELLEFVKEMQFDRLGSFSYSPEEGTPSFHFPNQVNESLKKKRLLKLMKLQQGISRKNLKKFQGQKVKVLVEGVSSESSLLLQGRLDSQAPEIDGCVLINDGEGEVGKFADVLISETHDYDLVGKILNGNAF